MLRNGSNTDGLARHLCSISLVHIVLRLLQESLWEISRPALEFHRPFAVSQGIVQPSWLDKVQLLEMNIIMSSIMSIVWCDKSLNAP